MSGGDRSEHWQLPNTLLGFPPTVPPVTVHARGDWSLWKSSMCSDFTAVNLRWHPNDLDRLSVLSAYRVLQGWLLPHPPASFSTSLPLFLPNSPLPWASSHWPPRRSRDWHSSPPHSLLLHLAREHCDHWAETCGGKVHYTYWSPGCLPTRDRGSP